MGKWDLKSLMTGLRYNDRFLASDQSQADGSQDRNVEVSELAAGFEREVSETSHGLSVGDAVRYNGAAYVEATADTSANAELLGIVSTVIDTDTFAYKALGLVTGLSGLTAGDFLYLQDAGGLGATPGTVGVPVGVALSTTSAWLTPLVRSFHASEQQLIEWTAGEDYEATSTTFDSDGVVTTATVKWPDGSAGTFTTDTKNTTWLAVDAYNITHTDSGLTVTQTAVTRDSDGAVTTKPALTVA